MPEPDISIQSISSGIKSELQGLSASSESSDILQVFPQFGLQPTVPRYIYDPKCDAKTKDVSYLVQTFITSSSLSADIPDQY